MVDQQVTIQDLSDGALLCIFSFLRPRWRRPYLSYMPVSSLKWAWHRLAHVCRRWRYLVFASPRYLGLGLVTSFRRRGTTLDLWPPFPISICYNPHWKLSPKDERDVLATLERHFDRIFEINLTISDSLLEKPLWMESFPALEHLCLSWPYPEPMVLPSGFLGGPAVASRSLRHIDLGGVSVPTLPQLLLSSRDLISLHLGQDVLTGDGFLSPAVLATSLSAAARLELLHVCLPSTVLHEEHESPGPTSPPSNLVVLPALTCFEWDGSSEYLEDLVSRIHAPLLKRIRVDVPEEDARHLDIPRLSQFVSQAERMSWLPCQTFIFLDQSTFKISHQFGTRGHLRFELTCGHVTRFFQVSRAIHICGQLSPLIISDAERVSIEVDIPGHHPPDAKDLVIPLWLRLFRLFHGTQELDLHTNHSLYESHDSPTMGQEAFPALRVLRLDLGLPVPRFIKAFVAERGLTGRPITMIRTSRHFESSSDLESTSEGAM